MSPIFLCLASALLSVSLFGTISVASEDLLSGYQRVPSGRLVPEECIHFVENGDRVREDDTTNEILVDRVNGGVDVIPLCGRPIVYPRPEHGSAWKTWAQTAAPSGQSISFLTGSWVVPPVPTNAQDQILYFWNGVEPTDTSAVLQPVLQWGSTPAGGGQYWAVASWYVSASHGVIVGPLINASPGDEVIGYNYDKRNGTWVIRGENSATGENSTIDFTPKYHNYTTAYQVLEAYVLDSCDEYPSSDEVSFYAIEVDVNHVVQPSPVWSTFVKQPITCNEHTTVTSADEV